MSGIAVLNSARVFDRKVSDPRRLRSAKVAKRTNACSSSIFIMVEAHIVENAATAELEMALSLLAVIFCVVLGGLMSGLTVGLLSLDPLNLKVRADGGWEGQASGLDAAAEGHWL